MYQAAGSLRAAATAGTLDAFRRVIAVEPVIPGGQGGCAVGHWARNAGLASALLTGALSFSFAQAQTMLTVRVDHVRSGGVIPNVYAYCVPARSGHTARGPNRSPAIAWSPGPRGTKSYAIVVVDTDVPADFTTADAGVHRDVIRAVRGHVLARGEVVGLYTQNPALARTLLR
jgi:hypothetical protein